ncbi:MAG TPA: PrsW family intramembrane metalloprotease [Thermomicrobiaceae bacterium]|nr:PrsW family intramembrane metalloprotease [Thermomicrobiaceae bacterium]
MASREIDRAPSVVGVPKRRPWSHTWLQILVVGVILFVALVEALQATGNPNYIPSMLMIGAFLVPVVFVSYIYDHEHIRDVAVPTVAFCFLWGGIVGTVVAGVLEYETTQRFGVLPLLAVGVIEEGAKLLAPLTLFARGRYRSEADGLLFGVASGMGFAALETMGYGFVGLLQSHGSVGVIEQLLLIRGILSPAGHAAWTGLICAVLWRERLRAGHVVINWAVISAFLVAVVLHALWDTFNGLTATSLVGSLGVLLVSLVIAGISIVLLVRRIREAGRAQLAAGGDEPVLP